LHLHGPWKVADYLQEWLYCEYFAAVLSVLQQRRQELLEAAKEVLLFGVSEVAEQGIELFQDHREDLTFGWPLYVSEDDLDKRCE
jgi:hypothetical protein